MSDSKPHKPTKRKLEKARQKGKVLKIQLLNSAVGTLFCLVSVALLLKFNLFKNQMLLEYSCDYDGLALNESLSGSLKTMSIFIVITLACALTGSTLTSALVSGFKVTWGNLSPRAERLNPVQGFKKIFSNFSILWQWWLRLILYCLGLYFLLKKSFLGLVKVTVLNTYAGSLVFWRQTSLMALCYGIGILLILGSLEYWINKKKFIKEMSMSHTELKNEHKEDEGDPLLKFSRKALHQEILSQDLVQRVKNSKVVIVEKI